MHAILGDMAWNVVIAGGGFGGFFAARTLERVLPPAAAKVTLVNDVNFMLYTPLLPGAAGGTLEPRHVVVPLREEADEVAAAFAARGMAEVDRRHGGEWAGIAFAPCSTSSSSEEASPA